MRTAYSWLVSRIALGLGAAVLVMVLVGISGCDEQKEFTAAEWRMRGPADGCDRKDYRKPMVSDLIDNHLQRGMTRAQVRRLLGPPDFEFDSTRKSTGWDYDIGHRNSDCVFVFVGFDPQGRLVQWFDSRDPVNER